MAINAFAFGAANFLDRRYSDPTAGTIPTPPVWLFYAAAYSIPLLLGVYMKWSRGGLRLLSVGNDPGKARQMGVFPTRIRFVALTATGICCGLSGSLLVASAKYYSDDMTAGRGFIALAALILGGWRPIPTVLACLAFGLFQGIQIQLQGTPVFGVQVRLGQVLEPMPGLMP